MRNFIMPLTLVAALGTASAASAATSTGTIDAINPAQMTVTLSDGSVYAFPDTSDAATRLANFKPGDEVVIHWIHVGTALDATAMSPEN